MSSPSAYSRSQIALHWAIALLILFNYVFSDGMGRALRQVSEGLPVTDIMVRMHVLVGIAVLLLVVLRLALRLWRGVPPESDKAPPLMRKAGRIGHQLLYVLMAAVPVLGMLTWFRGVATAGDIHQIAANALMILAGIHAAAALYHHYVIRDGLLRRMGLPLKDAAE